MLRTLPLLLVALLTACDKPAPTQSPTTLSIYSARNEQLIGPLLKRYEAETGVKTQLVTASAGPLLEKLKAEAATTPADLLLTVDAGNLWQAADAGLLQALNDEQLNAAIPEHLRDPQGHWYGLSVRARTLVYAPSRVAKEQLKSYADLAQAQWKNRLCLRTSRKVYNQSLVAMLMATHGPEQAEDIVKGWVANLAAPPFPNDTAVIKAVLAGQCDVGIVNTYYFGRLERDTPDMDAALFWPDQASDGVHVNVSGGGVIKHSDNTQAALDLLRWLASEQAQTNFAGDNLEYPANSKLSPVPQVAAWGEFKPNLINVSEAGRLQAEAVKLMDRAGYR